MRWFSILFVAALSLSGIAEAGELPDKLSYYDLVQYLSSGSAKERMEACKRLAARKSADAVPEIGRVVVEDPTWEVRSWQVSRESS